MALFIINNAAGQSPPAKSGSTTPSQAACELIQAALAKTVQGEDAAGKLSRHQSSSEQVLKLCPQNLVVAQTLKQAAAMAADTRDGRLALKLLQEGLRDAKATLAFKPFIEAPVPEGFPEPTRVGEIQVKQYPAYRLARTQVRDGETGAFWTLFGHIKKKEIAMTAPVEMTYTGSAKEQLKQQSMAFLYRTTKQGTPGKEGTVEVIDIPAMAVLSFGMRGDVTKARLAEAKAHLDAWLKQHAKEYEASGPLRVMGYNSPFVSADRRFTEVEIPVRRIVPMD